MREFEAFPKITRVEKVTVTLTEKIDGTNACIVFDEGGGMFCQSRNKIITPGKQTDNAGFASWAHANHEELYALLGEGRHFGEWWGTGIQRGYGQTLKRFSLFNTSRWDGLADAGFVIGNVPVSTVPVISHGPLTDIGTLVKEAHGCLVSMGSYAAPGFMDPEGCMVFARALGTYLKAPLVALSKWQQV